MISVLLFAVGFVLTFFPNTVRNHHLKLYKEGAERTGFSSFWMQKYPSSQFFRFFGILAIGFGAVIIYLKW